MPFTRGNVHIRTPGPLDYPAIDPKYWSLGYDVQTHIQANRFVRKLYGAEPLAGLVRGRGFRGWARCRRTRMTRRGARG